MDAYALKSVSDLPEPFRSAFNFRYFNSLQSECFPLCFHTDINMVISAPTASGKTVLFELCILRLFSKFISNDRRLVHTKGAPKTIYISPSKALVQEKLRDWSQKFGAWGINCLELTADSETHNMMNIQEAEIILTTPEKFDAVSRYRISSGGLSFFSDISLLLIDEVHLLNDPRGAALEAIVSRIKILSDTPEFKSSPLAFVRFLAVSATIPNIEDLAEWLKVPSQGIKRFGEETRPVKLTTKVFGYAAAKNDFLFEKRLQNYIFDILMQYSKRKSALVFCSTRKGTQEAAERLSQVAMTYGYSNPFIKSKDQLERLREASLSCSDKQMQSYIVYGVGFHNGGLCQKDRSLVEGLFLNGDIQVLCATNTLAHGINLPAQTVVIKSTQYFNKEKGLYMEYDRSTVLQMCGRAGRPPFDDTGMVIIMTRRETVHLYENLLSGCELVESQLLPCLTEHLTAEIVQLTVPDITRAIEWMKCSYLYVRMKKSPANYSLRKVISKEYVEKHLRDICIQKINELSRHQMIWTDSDGFLLKPQEPGRLMTKYYLKFGTMKHIMQTPSTCTLEELLHTVCHAEEIAWIQLRRNEKKALNDINMDKEGRLRFHINDNKGKRKRRIQTKEEKIFVLTNDYLTGDPSVHDLSMTQDANAVCSNGCRIAKCMKEYFIYKKNYKGAMNSTLLAKSLQQRLWDNSPYLLKQLPGIGVVTVKALHSIGVNSFGSLAEADPRRIEAVTGRKYPFGYHIKDSLLSLPPKVELKIEEAQCQWQGRSKIVVTLTRLSESVSSSKRHYADMIVGSEEDNIIHFHEKIRIDEFLSPYSPTIYVPKAQGKLTINADILFEEYIGVDVHAKLQLEESSADMKCKPRNKLSQYYPTEGVCFLEDGSEAKPIAGGQKLQRPKKSKTENASMPNFKLIDEDSGGEGDLDAAAEEDDCRIINEENDHENINEEDDCRIIDENTIFDHIREKAKNFPLFGSSNVASPTSLKALLLKRKRPREDGYLDLNGKSDIQEGTGESNIGQSPALHLSSDHDNPVDLTGSPSEPEERLRRSSTEDKIFDYIRKKSKNFPVLNTSKALCGGSVIEMPGHCAIENSKRAKPVEVHTDSIIISHPEEAKADKSPASFMVDKKLKESVLGESPYNMHQVWNSSPGISTRMTNPSPMKLLAFDISMLKKRSKLEEPGFLPEDDEKQRGSTLDSEKQRNPSSLVDRTNKRRSFSEFRSIFSFLWE